MSLRKSRQSRPNWRSSPMTQHLGKFEIRRELGRGAQSVVYLAFDPGLKREVAIKTLHFSRPDPAQNRYLLGEAQTVSQLRHANIVPIFEAGEEEGDLYLVFEYVPGKSLAQHLADGGALTPVRAVTLMTGILDALAHGVLGFRIELVGRPIDGFVLLLGEEAATGEGQGGENGGEQWGFCR